VDPVERAHDQPIRSLLPGDHAAGEPADLDAVVLRCRADRLMSRVDDRVVVASVRRGATSSSHGVVDLIWW
jgi:hypothetical protein